MMAASSVAAPVLASPPFAGRALLKLTKERFLDAKHLGFLTCNICTELMTTTTTMGDAGGGDADEDDLEDRKDRKDRKECCWRKRSPTCYATALCTSRCSARY